MAILDNQTPPADRRGALLRRGLRRPAGGRGGGDRRGGRGHDVVTVPGAMEVPAAVALAEEGGHRPAGRALRRLCGARLRGPRRDPSTAEVIANQTARGLMDLAIGKRLAIGSGVLTADSELRPWPRRGVTSTTRGGKAARRLPGDDRAAPAAVGPVPMTRAAAPHQARSVARLAAVQALYQMEQAGAGSELVVREFVDHRFGAISRANGWPRPTRPISPTIVRGAVGRPDRDRPSRRPPSGQGMAAGADRRHLARHPARRRLRADAPAGRADRGGDRRICRDRQILLRGPRARASSTPPSTASPGMRAADPEDGPVDEFDWIDRCLTPAGGRGAPRRSVCWTTPRWCRRARASTWWSPPTPSSRACISAAGPPGPGGAQAAAGQSVRSGGQGGRALRLSAVDRLAGAVSAGPSGRPSPTGCAEDQERFGLQLLGGDTTATPGPLTRQRHHLRLGSVRTAWCAAAARGRAMWCWSAAPSATAGWGWRRARRSSPTPRAWLADRYRLPQPRTGLTRRPARPRPRRGRRLRRPDRRRRPDRPGQRPAHRPRPRPRAAVRPGAGLARRPAGSDRRASAAGVRRRRLRGGLHRRPGPGQGLDHRGARRRRGDDPDRPGGGGRGGAGSDRRARASGRPRRLPPRLNRPEPATMAQRFAG